MTKLFFHNHEQTQALLGLTRDCVQKLASLSFNNPEEDQQNIRQNAYLQGKLNILQALLTDDFEVEAPHKTTEDPS